MNTTISQYTLEQCEFVRQNLNQLYTFDGDISFLHLPKNTSEFIFDNEVKASNKGTIVEQVKYRYLELSRQYKLEQLLNNLNADSAKHLENHIKYRKYLTKSYLYKNDELSIYQDYLRGYKLNQLLK